MMAKIGRMSVPASADAEWNEWYNDEYIPGYRKVPGVRAAYDPSTLRHIAWRS